MYREPKIDARAWLLWAVTALVAASATRNPLYTMLLFLVVTVVHLFCVPSRNRPVSPAIRFALLTVPLASLFNGLTAHLGDTALFRLPEWLPLLGGVVTAEALLLGAVNGLVLTVILAAFTTLNSVLPVHRLVRLVPRSFHEAGYVLSIALTFVPQTMRSMQRIREAQAVRGHRVRGVRGWTPILVPLVVDGLERSMGLAEAMVARGYGAASDQPRPMWSRAALALGLLALLSGGLAWLLLPNRQGVGGAGMLIGVALVGAVLYQTGRSVQRTVYHPHRWTARDGLVVLGCLLTLAVVLLSRGGLAYTPYPRFTLPPFDPVIGLGFLGLLAPAVARWRARRSKCCPTSRR